MESSHAPSRRGIQCAGDIIRRCKNGVVLTGAGVSTPSGIPDFRSPGEGLWEKVNPFEVASLTAFRHQPERFYRWIEPLARNIFLAQPNIVHQSLAELQRAGYVKAIITQNIDCLHQRAGSFEVVEVHGSLETMTCGSCYQNYPSESFVEEYLGQGSIPRCHNCGGVLKPDIILFGEQLPVKPWLKALEWSGQCDVMIVAGSSLEVLPVASLPMRALENGAHLIVVNKTGTYIDVRADVVFHDLVEDIVPRIVEEVLGG